ncbi:MAG: VOC family protein [Chitinophagales bacterium]
MKFKIGEFNIVCLNLEASILFYKDIMKFELTEKAETYAHFKCENITITLLAFAKAKTEVIKYGEKTSFSLDIKVNNLENAKIYFKEKGVKFAKSLDKTEGYFTIYDPNNLIWEIVEV